MVFGTRVLKYWVLGPSRCLSGGLVSVLSRQERETEKEARVKSRKEGSKVTAKTMKLGRKSELQEAGQ